MMEKSETASQTAASVVLLRQAAERRARDNPCFTALLAIDLAAEVAALDAGHVSEALAFHTLSLANLQPGALPRLLQHP